MGTVLVLIILGAIVALIVRIRELIWTAIGLLLIKLEKRGK